jgi:hypothetical protein
MLMQASDWTTKSLGYISIPHTSLFGSFVIPYWYVIAIIVAGVFYYYGFKIEIPL